MKKIHMISLITMSMAICSVFATEFTITNNTGKPIKFRPTWSGFSPTSKVTIQNGESVSYSTGAHSLQTIEWNENIGERTEKKYIFKLVYTSADKDRLRLNRHITINATKGISSSKQYCALNTDKNKNGSAKISHNFNLNNFESEVDEYPLTVTGYTKRTIAGEEFFNKKDLS